MTSQIEIGSSHTDPPLLGFDIHPNLLLCPQTRYTGVSVSVQRSSLPTYFLYMGKGRIHNFLIGSTPMICSPTSSLRHGRQTASLPMLGISRTLMVVIWLVDYLFDTSSPEELWALRLSAWRHRPCSITYLEADKDKDLLGN